MKHSYVFVNMNSMACHAKNNRAAQFSFRCLLNRRGVAAAPVDNPMARTAPPGPGSCLGQ